MREIETAFSSLDSSVYPLRVAACEDQEAPTSRYLIAGFNAQGHPACGLPYARAELLFQHGDPQVVGRNGITEEAVLSILLDRAEQRAAKFPGRATSRNVDELRLVIYNLRFEPEDLRV